MARVWDRAAGRQLASPTFRSIDAAKNWRNDTIAKLDRGEVPQARDDRRLGKAIDDFLDAARSGRARTKMGTVYKKRALADLESALNVHVKPAFGHVRLSDLRRGELQRLVDEKSIELSGSRVRTFVRALSSLYGWAQDRDYVSHNPAQRVRLPAMNAQPVERVATVRELDRLLSVLDAPDALPYALGAYGTARLEEARVLDWAEVDLELGVMYLGVNEHARKSAAAKRPVPLVAPLRARLRQEWLRRGRPASGLVLPPRGANNRSGLVSVQSIHDRAVEAWTGEGLKPIGMQECRHTAGSWLNAAGVNPKVASEIMGHSTPQRLATARAGGADITLSRYTHLLPGDLEGARHVLDAYIASERAQGA